MGLWDKGRGQRFGAAGIGGVETQGKQQAWEASRSPGHKASHFLE